MNLLRKTAGLLAFTSTTALLAQSPIIPANQPLQLDRIKGVKPKNVVFILIDDLRFDFMGFMGKVPGLKTPNIDRLARSGAHCTNTFCTTALSSPSRASILTGLYSHCHQVVDNQAAEPDYNIFFPQYLQKTGYQTAMIGKWHMGDENGNPRKGFDRWVSFKGQGQYYNPTINIDGTDKTYGDSTYITDLLTDFALDFMKARDARRPFFMYLSHKAVHAEFSAAARHRGAYRDMKIKYPASMDLTKTDLYKRHDIPEWVKEQRYSWHGVDYMYHGATNFDDFYRDYCETLLAVDESVGKLLDYLEANNLTNETVVMFMGDNGFSFGERGLIDKRHMYEESMKVPFLVSCPGTIPAGITVERMIQNIDVAPAVLELAGLKAPAYFQGSSFLPLVKGEKVANWRDRVFYEYFWEYQFPQTPTCFGVRTDRYKYIYYHGVWDTNEFYDLQTDPGETFNLIKSPAHQETIKQLQSEVWSWLETTHGMQIPLKRINQPHHDHKNRGYY